MNCLSSEPKYSPTPALESAKTRVHEVGQGGVQQWDQASIPATFRQSAGLQKCRERWAPICRAYYASTHLPSGQTPGISGRAKHPHSSRKLYLPWQHNLWFKVSVQFWAFTKRSKGAPICGALLHRQRPN